MYAHVQAFYRHHFNYDPETGVLTRARGALAGRVVSGKCHKGYLLTWVGGKNILAHRLIWALYYGEEPPPMLDHANQIRTDNRIANLREATASQNNANRRLWSNKTGYQGVRIATDGRRFRADISINNRNQYLGMYETAEEAATAYDRASIALRGEFAMTNGANHG